MARLRVIKLQEAIKQEVSKILLKDVKDPRIKSVTVTGVKLTEDLSSAKIYVSLYGAKDEQEAAWEALLSALGFIRTEIAKRIRLRMVPTFTFCRDTSWEYAARIDQLISKIHEEDGEKND